MHREDAARCGTGRLRAGGLLRARGGPGWSLNPDRGWCLFLRFPSPCAVAAWHSSPPQARSLFPRVSGDSRLFGDAWAGVGRRVPREVAASPEAAAAFLP